MRLLRAPAAWLCRSPLPLLRLLADEEAQLKTLEASEPTPSNKLLALDLKLCRIKESIARREGEISKKAAATEERAKKRHEQLLQLKSQIDLAVEETDALTLSHGQAHKDKAAERSKLQLAAIRHVEGQVADAKRTVKASGATCHRVAWADTSDGAEFKDAMEDGEADDDVLTESEVKARDAAIAKEAELAKIGKEQDAAFARTIDPTSFQNLPPPASDLNTKDPTMLMAYGALYKILTLWAICNIDMMFTINALQTAMPDQILDLPQGRNAQPGRDYAAPGGNGSVPAAQPRGDRTVDGGRGCRYQGRRSDKGWTRRTQAIRHR